VGSSSIQPQVQDNVKRVNVITSLRSGCLIYYNLEDLVDVPIELSLALSLPSLPQNDSTFRDAIDSTSIDTFPS